MRPHTVRRMCGKTLVALGLVLAGRYSSQLAAGGNPVAGGHPVPTSSVPTRAVPRSAVPTRAVPTSAVPSSSVPIRAVPTGSVPSSAVPRSSVPSGHAAAATHAPPTTSGDVRLGARGLPHGRTEGVVVIPVPPAAPERCSPSHVAVDVAQTAVVACRSANYGGPVVASVANPAIVSISSSGGLMIPRYLYISGREPGTTIVRVSYQHGPTTSYPITVYRAGTPAE